MSINLQKKISLVKNVLDKKRLTEKGQVAVAIDISGSMYNLFSDNTVQELVERLLAIGINMDLDQQIDVYLFGGKAYKAASATIDNIDGYVNREILYKYDLERTTLYEPVSHMIAEDAGHLEPKGFLSKMFSGPTVARQEPTYVFFVTDGDNFDKDQMTNLIRKVSSKPIFWQFVGIGDSDFDYLEHLDEMKGRYIDNANFFQAGDIASISDEELYERILGELPEWVSEAKRVGIL